MNTHYMHVLSVGPLIVVRVPWPMPPWRKAILPAVTKLMQAHGLKLRDVSAIEGAVARPDQTEKELENGAADRAKWDRAFDGDVTVFVGFKLYDWRDGAFVLVRDAA